jgi:hypothetical protein
VEDWRVEIIPPAWLQKLQGARFSKNRRKFGRTFCYFIMDFPTQSRYVEFPKENALESGGAKGEGKKKTKKNRQGKREER